MGIDGVTQRAMWVVMGVSGSGKSTVGLALAHDRGLEFVDGDTLHSAAAIAKMHHGIPLDDDDRAPWLDAVGHTLADEARFPAGVVVACSALKRRYRDRIRAIAAGVRFVYLAIAPAEAARRVAAREAHFMPASLIDSQFATLEVPSADETDVVTIDAGAVCLAAIPL